MNGFRQKAVTVSETETVFRKSLQPIRTRVEFLTRQLELIEGARAVEAKAFRKTVSDRLDALEEIVQALMRK